jgi:hypothetical protein
MALGSAHFIYVNGNDYKYATNSGGGWTNSTIEAGVTSPSTVNRPSIFADSTGDLHVSYWYASTALDLKYATSDDGGANWTLTTVATEDVSGKYSEVAKDVAHGILHIVYLYYDGGSTRELRHVKSGDGGKNWTMATTIEATYGDYRPSLALDSSGQPRVAYLNPSHDLRYAKYNGSSWTTYSVDSGGAPDNYYYCSIDVDSVDNAHIAYTSDTSFSIKYASGETSSWTTQTLTSGARSTPCSSLAIDRTDNDSAHILYSWEFGEKADYYLNYLTNRSGAWQTYNIDFDTNLTTNMVPIGVDSSHKVHFGYHTDGSTGTLKYKKQN